MMKYKGYHATTEYDQEEGVFYGDVVGIRDVIYFKSKSVDDLEKEFRSSIDDYLEWCSESGDPPNKPFSGVFMAHIAPEVHRAAVFAAYESGKSLDDWLEEMVKVAIAETKSTSVGNQPTPLNPETRNGAGDDDANHRRKTLITPDGAMRL